VTGSESKMETKRNADYKEKYASVYGNI